MHQTSIIIALLYSVAMVAMPLSSSFAEEKNTDVQTFIEQLNVQEGNIPPATSLSKEESTKTIARVEHYLNGLSTLVADFTQIDPIGNKATGTFFLSRPGKFRWQYAPPTPILIIGNGSYLSHYDYELNELTHLGMEDNLASVFIRKKISFSGDLTVEKLHVDKKNTQITITQKAQETQGSVTMIFSHTPFQLSQLQVLDATGQQTHIVFQNLRTEETLDPGLFVIKNPTIFRSKK